VPPGRLLWCHVLAVATGLVTLFGSPIFEGFATGDMARALQHEIFDTARHLYVGLPVCYLVAGLLGYLCPVRSWRWSLEMIGTHFVGTILFSGSGRDLWPLALVLALALVLRGIVTAWLGS
jgi:hypothetical protein